MLVIDKITKTFNPGTINEKQALKGLSLTVNDADFITIIGANLSASAIYSPYVSAA